MRTTQAAVRVGSRGNSQQGGRQSGREIATVLRVPVGPYRVALSGDDGRSRPKGMTHERGHNGRLFARRGVRRHWLVDCLHRLA